MKYEKLKLEAFSSKQTLGLIQNAVGVVVEFSYIKQIGDQDAARGYKLLRFESDMELLLLACSMYDKKLNLPRKQKRAVYQTKIDNYDDTDYPPGDINDSGYEAYHVDTDFLEIFVKNSHP
jgi:hypothetical protein